MKAQISSNHCYQTIILDISGLYAKIHDQEYCNEEKLLQMKKRYSDTNHWRIVVVDFA